MRNIKKGDIVSRNSYGNDILFYVEEIIKSRNMASIIILKGITVRIEASAYLDDLQLENRSVVDKALDKFNNSIENQYNIIMEKYFTKKESRKKFSINNALIMHLDGDKKYAEKSEKVYEKFKLNAIVKNIKENRQPYEVVNLLKRYNPDILVITGHDGMIKKGYKYNDIYNYRNSKYFMATVEEARKWEKNKGRLAIFAGACQSYYEVLIESGANFASSPARILIDFMDPLIVAQKIAMTPEEKFVTINDIKLNLRDGDRGISGVGSYGKCFV